MLNLDRYDRELIRLLQRDGRISNARLAESVHLSESSCLRRVRALEQAGLIVGYTAVLEEARAGFPVNVFVNVSLNRQGQPDLQAFEAAIARIPEVRECYLMSGEYDYLIRIAVADMRDFERVHNGQLTRLPGVARVHSSFAIRTVQRARELPVRGGE